MPYREVITPPNMLGIPSIIGGRAGAVVFVTLQLHTHKGVDGSTTENLMTYNQNIAVAAGYMAKRKTAGHLW